MGLQSDRKSKQGGKTVEGIYCLSTTEYYSCWDCVVAQHALPVMLACQIFSL